MNELYHIDRIDKTDYHRGYLQLLEELTVVESEKISYKDFCDNLPNINSRIFVIRNLSADKIVATGSIFIENKIIHRFGKVGHIEDIVVDPQYRKMGFGKKIVQHLVNIAKENGCYKVILDCENKYEGFYNKCGFKCKGIEMVKYF